MKTDSPLRKSVELKIKHFVSAERRGCTPLWDTAKKMIGPAYKTHLKGLNTATFSFKISIGNLIQRDKQKKAAAEATLADSVYPILHFLSWDPFTSASHPIWRRAGWSPCYRQYEALDWRQALLWWGNFPFLCCTPMEQRLVQLWLFCQRGLWVHLYVLCGCDSIIEQCLTHYLTRTEAVPMEAFLSTCMYVCAVVEVCRTLLPCSHNSVTLSLSFAASWMTAHFFPLYECTYSLLDPPAFHPFSILLAFSGCCKRARGES